jgi:hypothetical protein
MTNEMVNALFNNFYVNLDEYEDEENSHFNILLFDIKRQQNNFLMQFDMFNSTSKLKVRNEKLYDNILPKLIEKDISTENRHEDLANFRRYFEFLNIHTIKQMCESGVMIVDVGASTRLVNSYIVRFALSPTLSTQDHLRGSKLKDNIYTRVLKMTLQQFVDKYQNDNNYNKIVYNFTDSIYYISDHDLYKMAKNMNNGLIATGTMHIFKDTKVTLEIVDKLGLVLIDDENHVHMKVIDNETTYYHIDKWQILKNFDNYTIIGRDYNLSVIVEKRVELEASDYIRFVIVKNNMMQFSPNLSSLLPIERKKKRLENEERMKALIERSLVLELSKMPENKDFLYLDEKIITALYELHNGSVSFDIFKELLNEVIIEYMIRA